MAVGANSFNLFKEFAPTCAYKGRYIDLKQSNNIKQKIDGISKERQNEERINRAKDLS